MSEAQLPGPEPEPSTPPWRGWLCEIWLWVWSHVIRPVLYVMLMGPKFIRARIKREQALGAFKEEEVERLRIGNLRDRQYLAVEGNRELDHIALNPETPPEVKRLQAANLLLSNPNLMNAFTMLSTDMGIDLASALDPKTNLRPQPCPRPRRDVGV